MAVTSSWLVGSLVLSSSATIVVDGANNAVIAAGTYYLRDPSSSLSLIDVILAAVTPYMTTPSIFVGKDRKLRVTAGASFTWSIPAALQVALGFGASIASTTAATASAISNLLWSPGWPETTVGHPVGTSGWRDHDDVQTASASGLTSYTELHNYTTNTGLVWQQVPQARLWTDDDGVPGDFWRFMLDVIRPGRRWKLYSGITEDDADGSTVSWTTPLGPYIRRGDIPGEWWDRAIKSVDTLGNVRIDAMITGEIA